MERRADASRLEERCIPWNPECIFIPRGALDEHFAPWNMDWEFIPRGKFEDRFARGKKKRRQPERIAESERRGRVAAHGKIRREGAKREFAARD